MLPFLTLENIHVACFGKEALSGISLEVREGQHWAITGAGDSGKTILLETLAGKHLVRKGTIRHHYYQRFLESGKVDDSHFNYKRLVAEVTLHHHFKNRYNLGEFYYQQRFNSADADEAVSVRDYLTAVDQEVAGWHPGEEPVLPKIIGMLHLDELLDKSLIKLSNGETRRLQFAAALMKRPSLLLLDSPFTGLDENSRPYFHDLINGLMASGITVIMSTPEDEIPAGMTHVAQLDAGRLTGTWERADFERALTKMRLRETRSGQAGRAEASHPALVELLSDWPTQAFSYAVRMRNVSIVYENTQVLSNVNWEVRKGTCWTLRGPNGAGKSTLLSLITADNPQGYANDLELFDRQRGTGESIWDIKKKIGFVSPEMHQYFKTSDTCLQIILSGYFDTLGLVRECTPVQRQGAASWMEVLGLSSVAGSRFSRVPLSTQRLVLLARALVKKPPLLILDEPCQGMDAGQIARIRQLIDAVCQQTETTLIYVSHYPNEIPSCVDQLLELREGKVIYCGPYEARV